MDDLKPHFTLRSMAAPARIPMGRWLAGWLAGWLKVLSTIIIKYSFTGRCTRVLRPRTMHSKHLPPGAGALPAASLLCTPWAHLRCQVTRRQNARPSQRHRSLALLNNRLMHEVPRIPRRSPRKIHATSSKPPGYDAARRLNNTRGPIQNKIDNEKADYKFS